MKVLYVGHATLWVEVGGITILTDPWLQGLAGGRYVHDPELVTPLDDIRSPDVIVLSHAHPDHFNIPSLELLDRGAQVIVPKHFGKTLAGPDVDGLDIGWRNPDLEHELRQLGFTRVTPVSVGEQVQLDGGVRIVPVPSHQHRFPEMGMVITGPGGTLYNAVDTWPGEDALGDVAALQPDIVFLPFRFYLPPNLWPAADLADRPRLRTVAGLRKRFRWAGPLRAAQTVAVLRPRAVVPGAEGFRDTISSAASQERLDGPNYHDISVGQREDFVRLVRRFWPETAAFPMGPGHRWSGTGGFAAA